MNGVDIIIATMFILVEQNCENCTIVAARGKEIHPNDRPFQIHI